MNARTMSVAMVALLAIVLGATQTAVAQNGEDDPAPDTNATGADDTGAPTGTGTAAALMQSTEPEKGPFGEIWDEIVIRWNKGGRTMYGLALFAAITVIFTIERLVSIVLGLLVPMGVVQRANKLWQAGEYEKVRRVGLGNMSTMGKIIAFFATHRNAPFDHLNTGAEDLIARSYHSHSWRNLPLLVAGTVSPLLGLLGTVFGLEGAFAKIGQIGSMDDPSALAGDIGLALVTTIGGLLVALPSLILYHLFRALSGILVNYNASRANNVLYAWFLDRESSGGKS